MNFGGPVPEPCLAFSVMPALSLSFPCVFLPLRAGHQLFWAETVSLHALTPTALRGGALSRLSRPSVTCPGGLLALSPDCVHCDYTGKEAGNVAPAGGPWLRLCTSPVGDTGSIPGQGIKILHAMRHS